LVLGGYGTFGGRIALRSASLGFDVIVAGRDLGAAEAFSSAQPRLRPLQLARERVTDELLVRERIFAVVDAAGPFQQSDHSVAQAAIGARCHYIDIADGTAFVSGAAALDGQAKAAGICVISGASSLPALSGAVTASLADGLDQVGQVEIVLSASSRGTAGRSVTQAILSYLGRRVRLRQGGRWTEAWGWQNLRRFDFDEAGSKPLRGRLAAVADVPDLILLPGRLPGMPAVSFYAGTDAPWHNLGLWLLSWVVRWGWLRHPERLAGILSKLQHWTRGSGSMRSAFQVRLVGRDGARRIERRWTLIAENGEGPEIPALAVPLLLAKLRGGLLPAGAGDAGGLLSLESFMPSLDQLATRCSATEEVLPPPLFARILAGRFVTLPAAVQRLHDILGDGGACGEAVVTRGRHPVARLIAMLFRFPPAGEHRLHVAFAEQGGGERWIRDFGGHSFDSFLSEQSGRLVERFGPLRFASDLVADGAGLRMSVRRWWCGPVPLPPRLAPQSEAREWEEAGQFCFDVPIHLPWIGLLIHYRGWLVPAGPAEPATAQEANGR
jgi:hypothetical protein